ncbi:MAG: hypothetical protein LC623_05915 [Halobacteriales archaeon]|nr:hypothetical protein [Halobacteriales archaeon]
MMLLTAIVLLVGFVALAGMVSRVSLLAHQAGREQDRPLLREVEPLQKGLNAALDPASTGKGLGSMGLTAPSVAYESGVKGVLEHLRRLQAERGFISRWTVDCDLTAGVKDTAKGFARLLVSDGELQVTIKSTPYFARTSCAVLSG